MDPEWLVEREAIRVADAFVVDLIEKDTLDRLILERALLAFTAKPPGD